VKALLKYEVELISINDKDKLMEKYRSIRRFFREFFSRLEIYLVNTTLPAIETHQAIKARAGAQSTNCFNTCDKCSSGRAFFGVYTGTIDGIRFRTNVLAHDDI
jgi:hypothetical protein